MITNHLEALGRQPVQDAQVYETLLENKKKLQENIKNLEEKVVEIAKKKWNEEYRLLLTIPGIGPAAAITLLVITNGFTKFDSVKEFLSFIGMAPKPFQSGTSVKGKGHISKMGSFVLRKILVCARGLPSTIINSVMNYTKD